MAAINPTVRQVLDQAAEAAADPEDGLLYDGYDPCQATGCVRTATTHSDTRGQWRCSQHCACREPSPDPEPDRLEEYNQRRERHQAWLANEAAGGDVSSAYARAELAARNLPPMGGGAQDDARHGHTCPTCGRWWELCYCDSQPGGERDCPLCADRDWLAAHGLAARGLPPMGGGSVDAGPIWVAHRPLDDGSTAWYASLDGATWVEVNHRVTPEDAADVRALMMSTVAGEVERGPLTYATRYLRIYDATIEPPPMGGGSEDTPFVVGQRVAHRHEPTDDECWYGIGTVVQVGPGPRVYVHWDAHRDGARELWHPSHLRPADADAATELAAACYVCHQDGGAKVYDQDQGYRHPACDPDEPQPDAFPARTIPPVGAWHHVYMHRGQRDRCDQCNRKATWEHDDGRRLCGPHFDASERAEYDRAAAPTAELPWWLVSFRTAGYGDVVGEVAVQATDIPSAIALAARRVRLGADRCYVRTVTVAARTPEGLWRVRPEGDHALPLPTAATDAGEETR